MKGCSVEGCTSPHSTGGLCKRHYNRAYYLANAERARAKAQALRERNPSAHRADSRRRYEQDPEKFREYQRTYRKDNAELVRAKDRTRYKKNAEARREYMRNYRKAHPDKVRAHVQKRLAMKRGATVGEKIMHAEIAERDGWRCHICGKPVTRKEWSLDHLVPLSAGGQHTRVNVALAHRRCNSQRHTGRIPAQLLLVG